MADLSTAAAGGGTEKSTAELLSEWANFVGDVFQALMLGILFLLCVMVIVLLFRNRRKLTDKLLELSALRMGAVEMSFERAAESLDEIMTKMKAFPPVKKTTAGTERIIVTRTDSERVYYRFKRSGSVLNGRSLLWVDDRPANNDTERHLFESLGARVFFALDNDRALELLIDTPFDVIISDIGRPEGVESGLKLPARLPQGRQPPVIFYISEFDPEKPKPPGSFGITNRPDELAHLVLDALERVTRDDRRQD